MLLVMAQTQSKYGLFMQVSDQHVFLIPYCRVSEQLVSRCKHRRRNNLVIVCQLRPPLRLLYEFGGLSLGAQFFCYSLIYLPAYQVPTRPTYATLFFSLPQQHHPVMLLVSDHPF